MSRADALLLLAQARDTDTFIPGKTFEYIGSRKPILALSNSHYTNDLLKDYSAARIVTTADPDEIATHLLEFVRFARNAPVPESLFINQFNRKLQTKELADCLNAMIK